MRKFLPVVLLMLACFSSAACAKQSAKKAQKVEAPKPDAKKEAADAHARKMHEAHEKRRLSEQ